ncbi:high mobility group box domain-containing protein, partial [Sparassis latifolia]
IPRPPNCFILFRTDWCHRLEGQVERSHKQISRIAGKAWKRMSETQKVVWRERARIIKEEHKRCYPDYKFAPVQRKQKPKKR